MFSIHHLMGRNPYQIYMHYRVLLVLSQMLVVILQEDKTSDPTKRFACLVERERLTFREIATVRFKGWRPWTNSEQEREKK